MLFRSVRAAVLANGGTVICEAFGRVEVGIPVAMILSTQSDRLCVGCSMPIYPSVPKVCLVPYFCHECCTSYLTFHMLPREIHFPSTKLVEVTLG